MVQSTNTTLRCDLFHSPLLLLFIEGRPEVLTHKTAT